MSRDEAPLSWGKGGRDDAAIAGEQGPATISINNLIIGFRGITYLCNIYMVEENS